MTSLRLDTFAGIAPRYSKRLLPPTAATSALNCKLMSGDLRGFRAPRELKSFSSTPYTVRRVHRIPSGSGESFRPDADDVWMTFASRDVDIVRSPLANDGFDRYYWSGDGVLKYNTKARIAAGDPAYRLGVPTPQTAPTISVGTGTIIETRSYVYTFVTAYGEEGPPSPPVTASGSASSTWSIGNLDTTVPDESERAVVNKRIYRTVVGKLSTAFYYVGEINMASTSFTDNVASTTVASNNQLESTSWLAPPEDLQGLVVMPNGFLAGFKDRDVYFSEPYRPHAFPVEYVLSTEYPIVGLAVFGATLAILTQSHPFLGSGVNPAAVTLQKLNTVEPCLTKRSIVTTLAGVFYASPNGIVQVNSSGAQVVSYDLLTKEEWVRQFIPTGIFAAPLGLEYVGFDSESSGFVYRPSDQFAKLTRLDRFDNVDGLDADPYSGELYLIKDNVVYLWDPPDSVPLYYTWKSKEFITAKPVNFGAAKIKFESAPFDIENDLADYYGGFNAVRITTPLNAIARAPIGGVRRATVPGWLEPQNRSPIGGSPLIPLTLPLPGVRLTVYVKDEVIYSNVIYDEQLIRLPAGFKSDVWQFEMVSNSTVYSLVVAETPKELETV
jgi:hypothetical protein